MRIVVKIGTSTLAHATGRLNIRRVEELCKVLSKFPEKVLDAVAQYEPSVITRYVIDVCTAFNRFYQACPVLIAEDPAVRATRVRLTRAAGYVLRNALRLVCIKTPEKI